MRPVLLFVFTLFIFQLQAQQSLAVYNRSNGIRYEIKNGYTMTAIDTGGKKYSGELKILDSVTIVVGPYDTVNIGSLKRVNKYGRSSWGTFFTIGASGGFLLSGVLLNAGLRDPKGPSAAFLFFGAFLLDVISIPPLFFGLHLIHRTNVKQGNYLKVIQSNS